MSASCLGWIWTWSSLKDRRDQWVPVWPLQNRYTHITSHLQNSDRWSKTGRSSLWIQQTKTVSSSSSFNRCLFSHSHIQRTNCLKGSLNLEIRCKEWLQSNGAGRGLQSVCTLPEYNSPTPFYFHHVFSPFYIYCLLWGAIVSLFLMLVMCLW